MIEFEDIAEAVLLTVLPVGLIEAFCPNMGMTRVGPLTRREERNFTRWQSVVTPPGSDHRARIGFCSGSKVFSPPLAIPIPPVNHLAGEALIARRSR